VEKERDAVVLDVRWMRSGSSVQEKPGKEGEGREEKRRAGKGVLRFFYC
jgi:hypothetical protein